MWQPIKTAPKDGTRVLIVADGNVEIAAWHKAYREEGLPAHWLIDQHNDYEFCTIAVERRFSDSVSAPLATHWMPLPEPPKS